LIDALILATFYIAIWQYCKGFFGNKFDYAINTCTEMTFTGKSPWQKHRATEVHRSCMWEHKELDLRLWISMWSRVENKQHCLHFSKEEWSAYLCRSF
jgi:hypothetical protein